MSLILTAPGIISSPTFKVPDFTTGRYLSWDARDIVASNGASVSSWPAEFQTTDTQVSRSAMEAVIGVAGLTLPTYVTNARGGIPGVRFGGTSALVAGYRAPGTPADSTLIKLAGQAVCFTTLARMRETAPGASPSAVFTGTGPSDHRLRQGSSDTNRLVVQTPATALSPFIEMPGAVGNWFAVTVVWNKPANQITACVNGGPLLTWTPAAGTQPASWTQLALGRIIADANGVAAGVDYARVEMHARRALSHVDMIAFHASLKAEYGVTDY